MRRSLAHQMAAGFLALALLVAPLPVTSVRHAHPGGEQAHSHDGPGYHDHAACDHSHHEHACHERGYSAPLPAGDTSHVHLLWLGLDLGQHRGDQSESEPDSSNDISLSRLVEQPAASTLGKCVTVQAVPKVNCLPWTPADADGHGQLTYRTQSQPPVSLCDAARRERSGVLVV